MESFPVQTWAVVSHDDRGELCRAHFERWLEFDLQPLRDAYQDDYHEPGQVILRLRDYLGQETRFLFGP